MAALVSLILLLGAPSSDGSLGTLWNRQETWQCGGGMTYHPREGDLVFFSSTSPIFALIFGAGRTSHPYHVGMVVRDRHGHLVILESGGTKEHRVVLSPVVERMTEYLEKRPYRRIWVRRNKVEVTPEQSRCLTCFAHAQDGKRFAGCLRMATHVLPGRPLEPTHANQGGWFCAELVCEAMRQSGMCPACWVVPEKSTPRDLFHDVVNVSCGWHVPETWSGDEAPPPPGPWCAPR